MQALAKELNSLAAKVQALQVQTKRRKRKPRPSPVPGTSGTVVVPRTRVNQGPRRQRRPRAPATALASGDVLVTKRELVLTLTLKKGLANAKGHIDVLPDSFPWLKKLFSSFERIRFEKLAFCYSPLVGTTYGGALTMGMDWDWSGDDVDRSKIAAYSPSVTMPLYGTGGTRRFTLPASRLQSRSWYAPRTSVDVDKGPGRLRWALDGTSDKDSDVTVGDVWVEYTVRLSGTQA